jgi:hypothetical protein
VLSMPFSDPTVLPLPVESSWRKYTMGLRG